MKLLIATPAYAGQMTTQFFTSIIQCLNELSNEGIDYEILTLANESLIPRARNRCATYAVTAGFDKLMFIDADLSWSWDMMRRVLLSDKDIVGGTYPIKAFPICLNFNPLDNQRDIFGPKGKREIDHYLAFVKQYADDNYEVEVEHIPTGFMVIDTSVLVDLISKERVAKYVNFDGPTGIKQMQYEFFPTGVTPDGEYLSEDWAFCELARSSGHKIYLQAKAVCGHTGTHTYQIGQYAALGQFPLISK